MLTRKFVFLFVTLTMSLAIALYFPRTTAAQSEVERLIPLFSGVGDPEPIIPQTFREHNFVIYGRAGCYNYRWDRGGNWGIPRALSPRLLRMHRETLE